MFLSTTSCLSCCLAGQALFWVKRSNLDSRPLGRVIFYILSPVLIFNLLTSSKLAVESIFLMMGYSASVMLIIAGIAFVAGKLLRLERSHADCCGSHQPVCQQRQLRPAAHLLCFWAGSPGVRQHLLCNEFPTALHRRRVNCRLGHLRLKEALLGLLKVPAIYAIILAVIFIRTGWNLPAPIQKTVELTAGGAVPAMIILLGLELQKVEWTNNLRALSIPVVCRLLVGPVIGLVMAALFGLNNIARKDGITEAGMPSAVMTTVLANEYKLDTSLVTAIVFVGTILSPLTLTPLLYLLGR